MDSKPDHLDSAAPAAPAKRVTLQDIADRAGVQKMVVSNALNDTRSVAPATKEKIRRIAAELNYIPNFAARALSSGNTNIIAVVSGPLDEPYYGGMVQLLENSLSADGYYLLLLRTSSEIEALVKSTGKLAVDGAIAIDRLNLVDELRSHPTIPCVSISTARQQFVDNIFIDLSQSVAQALEIMMCAGRERIAYLVTADALGQPSEVRAGTYIERMKSAGRAVEIINVATDDIIEVGARFRDYIERNGCPDALLCQNDETAMSAFAALRASGRSVPDDVLLVGCDGQHHMKYLDPPLSTIAQPKAEIARLAWKFLRQRLARPGLPHQQIAVPGELIVRASLQTPPRDEISPPRAHNSRR